MAGVRWEFDEKEVEMEVAKKQAAQHENHADQIKAVARRRQEEVARLTDNIDYLRDALESAQEWREEYNRQAREIKYLQQKDILDLQQNMDASEIKCLE